MDSHPDLAAAETAVSEAAAELRRWPAEVLANRQQRNDQVGRTLEQLTTIVRSLSERLAGTVGNTVT